METILITKMDKMGVDMSLQGKLMSNSHKTHLKFKFIVMG